ncbi:hypothetical protein DICPUDRAFT_151870 [Dictyostelium purpureum]|uniref:Uncharacterized protein n=1 Tax=Dictyostelium purpureum TaxID=5786 RepID=F0ZJY9_DICPU|nr:uncharacterized protein DICPUDRAFT_151870 [Dictyostelium purpureum]EGC35729.1 hypothetical protein DICPUDRAFT_151870 [Dictyostelium purpureum]|eukprot:XP_003287732.1 hypothetical protein DICPUDRAFT_151870 [Dictyostelium purpureum]
MDNYNSNSIPGFDDKWFNKKLFDTENQRLLVQGYYSEGKTEDSFQVVNAFIHAPDPYRTCQDTSSSKEIPYCPYRQFPFYVRDGDRCLHQKCCIPLGVCLTVVKPVCINGYNLTYYRGETNGCLKYYCDFYLLDEIKSKY